MTIVSPSKPLASLSTSKIGKHSAFALLNLEISIRFLNLSSYKIEWYLPYRVVERFERDVRSRIDFF